jgi:homoserine dehydrogenase
MKTFIQHLKEELSKADLDAVERMADKLFAKVGIDIEFTHHFLDRVNDARNKKPISSAELVRLFKQTYKKHGKKIPKLGDKAQAVLHDINTDINVPFVLKWDDKSQEFDLVSKTIMRKKDFKTPNKKIEV